MTTVPVACACPVCAVTKHSCMMYTFLSCYPLLNTHVTRLFIRHSPNGHVPIHEARRFNTKSPNPVWLFVCFSGGRLVRVAVHLALNCIWRKLFTKSERTRASRTHFLLRLIPGMGSTLYTNGPPIALPRNPAPNCPTLSLLRNPSQP